MRADTVFVIQGREMKNKDKDGNIIISMETLKSWEKPISKVGKNMLVLKKRPFLFGKTINFPPSDVITLKKYIDMHPDLFKPVHIPKLDVINKAKEYYGFFVTKSQASNIPSLRISQFQDTEFVQGGTMWTLIDIIKHKKSSSLKNNERNTLLAIYKAIEG